MAEQLSSIVASGEIADAGKSLLNIRNDSMDSVINREQLIDTNNQLFNKNTIELIREIIENIS